MTTLTTTYNITCQVCEYIANAFKETFKTIIKSRQMAANAEVARQLQQLGFYGRDEDLKHIIMQLNQKTSEEYKKF
jgi:L-lactate utilization protein LutB|tara:strand:+ start:424 stop:651 length:228 start_codon:yes stop_codon:yes gene_type:complete